jgi:hypothetical protein
MVRARGQGGGLGRSADLAFQSQPQILQNPAEPAQDSAKFFKEKSLDFLGEKIIHGFGAARCVIEPNDLCVVGNCSGQVA